MQKSKNFNKALTTKTSKKFRVRVDYGPPEFPAAAPESVGERYLHEAEPVDDIMLQRDGGRADSGEDDHLTLLALELLHRAHLQYNNTTA